MIEGEPLPEVPAPAIEEEMIVFDFYDKEVQIQLAKSLRLFLRKKKSIFSQEKGKSVVIVDENENEAFRADTPGFFYDDSQFDDEPSIPNAGKRSSSIPESSAEPPSSLIAQISSLLESQKRQFEVYVDKTVFCLRKEKTTQIVVIKDDNQILNLFMQAAPTVDYTTHLLAVSHQGLEYIIENQNATAEQLQNIFQVIANNQVKHRMNILERVDFCSQMLDNHPLEIKYCISESEARITHSLNAHRANIYQHVSEEVRKRGSAITKTCTDNAIWISNTIRFALDLPEINFDDPLEEEPISEGPQSVGSSHIRNRSSSAVNNEEEKGGNSTGSQL